MGPEARAAQAMVAHLRGAAMNRQRPVALAGAGIYGVM